MKIEFISSIPTKDNENDMSFRCHLLPNIELSHQGSAWGDVTFLYISWLFWELEIEF